MHSFSTGTGQEAYDVCLLSMPFPPINQPSMALGVLKPSLVRAGISVATLYPCLWAAETFGLDLYSFIGDSKQEFLLGEWVFAGAAFPEHNPDHEAYLDRILSAPVSDGLRRKSRFGDDPRQSLNRARELAVGFVDDVAKQVLRLRPRIVGCTSTFMQHCSSLALLRRIRELEPGIVTIIGGANCEGEMGAAAIKSFPWLDFAFSGEADLAFPLLCQRILSLGMPVAPTELPEGVIGRDHSCVLFGSPVPRASVQKMDQTPVPDFDDYFAALEQCSFRPFVSPGLAMETSRGCWWGKVHHCTFCGLNGGNMDFRSKSPERVVFELEHLSRRHGIRRFNIVDNILDLQYIQSLLPQLAGAEPYTLFYETKSNLRREQLETIAAAGIHRLQPGIESMHDEILRLIDKGTTALQNIRLLKWARELGIFITWNFLWDVPGEKDEWYGEMADWLPLACHLQPPGVDRIQFHRFSPYHQRPRDFGLALEPYPSYSCVYPIAPAGMRDLAYYFDSANRAAAREELVRRPNLRRVIRIIGGWNRLWGQGGLGTTGDKPLLLAREADDAMVVEDTRPCAVSATHFLEALPARVFRACADIQTEVGLQKTLSMDGGPAALERDLIAALNELRERRLILRLNGRYLGLALTQVRPIPEGPDDFPGGTVDLEAWRLHDVSHSVAMQV
jgi:magnesium-protoporphyrin IX monomethyl ester (oxidative) cyclase